MNLIRRVSLAVCPPAAAPFARADEPAEIVNPETSTGADCKQEPIEVFAAETQAGADAF